MDGVEVENLLVRLSGDASSYQKMLGDAQSSTASTAKGIEEAGKSIERVSQHISGFANTALNALGALGATEWLKEAFAAFSEAEKVDAELGATLRANDRDVKVLQKDYAEWATMVEHSTTMGDEAVKMLLRSAESFDLTGDAAKDAVKQAIGLGAATGSSADAMIRLTSAMAKGDIDTARMFSRLVPQLRGIKDESLFVARYQKLVASGFETATEEANTAAGQIKQLNEAYGDLLEIFGQIVAEGIKPVVGWIKQLVYWFQGLSKHIQTIIVAVAALSAGFLALSAAIGVAGLVSNTVFGGAGILIGLLVTAGAAIGLWVSQLGGVAEAWKSVEAASSETIGSIISFGENVVASVENWLDSLGDVQDMWPAIQNAAMVAWNAIAGFAMDFWGQVYPVLVEFGQAFSELWADAIPIIQEVAQQVMAAWSGFDAGTSIIKGVLVVVKVIGAVIYSVAGGILMAVRNAGLLLATIGQITVEFQPIANTVMDIANALADQLLPLFKAFYKFGESAFKGVLKFAQDFGDGVQQIWKDIFGGATITWGDIKSLVIDTLRNMEFGIRHFGELVTQLWLNIAIQATKAFSEIKWFFTQTLPAYGKFVIDFFREVFIGVFVMVTDIMKATLRELFRTADKITTTIIDAFSNNKIGDLFDPTKKTHYLGGIINDAMKNAKDAIIGASDDFKAKLPTFDKFEPPISGDKVLGIPPKFPDSLYKMQHDLDELTRTLDNAKASFDMGKEMEELSKGFEDVQGTIRKIRQQRWFDFPLFHDMKKVEDDALDFSLNLGKGMGKEINKGLGKELKGMDAVIKGSFEHLEFLETYFQQLEDMKREIPGYKTEAEKRSEIAAQFDWLSAGRGQTMPKNVPLAIPQLPPIPSIPDIMIPGSGFQLPSGIDQLIKGQIQGGPSALPPIMLPPRINMPAGSPVVPDPTAIPGVMGLNDTARDQMVTLLQQAVDHLSAISGKPNLTIKTAGLG